MTLTFAETLSRCLRRGAFGGRAECASRAIGAVFVVVGTVESAAVGAADGVVLKEASLDFD